jgi:dTDP-glucose 4,6-dehydratase
MIIFVTGVADFKGSNLVLDWPGVSHEPVMNLGKFTYEGNLENLLTLQGDARHLFVRGYQGNPDLVADLHSGVYREGVAKQYREINV